MKSCINDKDTDDLTRSKFEPYKKFPAKDQTLVINRIKDEKKSFFMNQPYECQLWEKVSQ